MKKIALTLMVVILLGITACTPASVPQQSGQPSEQPSAEKATEIILAQENITVDGKEISTDQTNAVYLVKQVETHPDAIEGVENNRIVIASPGVYRFSGAAEDTQIYVDIPEDKTEATKLILNNLDIICRTAPAILVWSAHETDEAGTGSVTLELADNSKNTVAGSHTAKDEAQGITKKNDAAISSNVSMVFQGGGSLVVNADKEGIESKMHLTINSGNIEINSHDDAINASEDNVSHIIINGGQIIARSTLGKEGDGIDSNGYITINGGTVIAFANETSMDSGLDSDLGVKINGGTVVATGNMYDEISAESEQAFMVLNFAQPKNKDDLVVLTDADGNPIFAYQTQYRYSNLCISSDKLVKGQYRVYSGGNMTGEAVAGVYLTIDSYSGGTEQQHGGTGGFGMGRPGGMRPPQGEAGTPPANFEQGGQMPPTNNDMTGQRPQRPQGGGPMTAPSAEVSTIFDLSVSTLFYNVTNKAA